MIKLLFFAEMAAWSVFVVGGAYQVYKRDFCGPKNAAAEHTDLITGRGRGSPVIQIKPETEKEKRARLKRELELDQARTTIELCTPIIQTLQAEKQAILNDLAIVAAGSRKQTQLLNRLYTIDTRIYTQACKLEKAEHTLENE